MEYKLFEKEGFTIVGIEVRTTNNEGQSQKDIEGLWNKFMGQNLIARIPNKEAYEIYCIYTDYESDFTGQYTTILGCRVSSLHDIPEGFIGRTFAASKYRHYKAVGSIPICVGEVWREIWASDIDRRYLADFDVYGEKAQSPENAEVDIYLSIK